MFNVDPRTPAATPDQLSFISISFTYDLAYDTMPAYGNVINNVPDGELKFVARQCLTDYYVIAIRSIQAYNYSAMHMYSSITQFTGSAGLSNNCGAQAPIKSSTLQLVNIDMIFRCQIAESVNTYLKKS
ncbi:hypothetical protein ACFE04_009335 [Oxalis oulophora]